MSVVLATAGYDHMIRFWEAPTGVCIRSIKFANDSQINKLEISPEKQFIAAAGNPHIRLYEINQNHHQVVVHNPTPQQQQQQPTDPAVLTLEGHTSNVTSIGFQRDGRYLYSGSEDGTLKIWDLSNSYCSRSFQVNAPVNSVCLRTDRDELITADQNGYIKIWDLGGSGTGTGGAGSSSSKNKNHGLIHSVKPSAASSGFDVLSNNNNNTNDMTSTMSVDSSTIYSNKNKTSSVIPGQGTTRIKAQRNQPYVSQHHHHRYATEGIVVPIQAVDISQDSRTLVAITNRGTVYVWDPSRHNNLSFLDDTLQQQNTDPTYLHTTTSNTNNSSSSDGYLRPITKFRAHTEHPGTYCLHGRIAPDCRHLVTTASDGTAKLWDTTTWELTQALIQQPIPVVPPPPTITGSQHDRHQRTNTTRGTQATTPATSSTQQQQNPYSNSKWVWDAAFCADSSYLITASSDRVARLWNLRTGDVVRQYHGHQSAVTCVALNDSSIE